MGFTDDGRPICPDCGEPKDNIGNHWHMSSQCHHPTLTDRQEAILTGLMLGGGLFQQPYSDRYNPILRTTSTNERFLEWLEEEFGILSTDHRELISVSEVNESSIDNPPQKALDTGGMIHEWKSRALPTLDQYVAEWYPDPDAGKQIPDDIDRNPLTLAVLFAKAGRISHIDARGHKEAIFVANKTIATTTDYERLLQPFDPHPYDNEDQNAHRVHLWETQGFFEYIGFDPIPGFEDEWPAVDDRMLATVGDEWDQCPTCRNHFEKIGHHWQDDHSDCTPPQLTTDQRAVITGLLLAGAPVVERDSSSGPRIQAQTTKIDVLHWLNDQLGVFAGRVHGGETREAPDFWGAPDGTEVEHPHRLLLRHTAQLGTLIEHVDATTDADLGDVLALPPLVLKTIYLLRGNRTQSGASSSRKTYLNAHYMRPSVDVLVDWLQPFDAVEGSRGDQPSEVRIRNDAAFFDYLGDPPAGLDHLWPSEAQTQ